MAMAVLGEHPISAELKMSMIYLAVAGTSAWAIGQFSRGWGLTLLLLTVVAGILALKSMGSLVGYWIRGHARLYRLAGKAIAQGSLVPSYVGRDAECSSIVIVDEANRQLFINGNVFAYEDVRTVGTRSSTEVSVDAYRATTTNTPWIEFHLLKGDNPLQRVYFDSVAARDNFYARLCNSMNLS